MATWDTIFETNPENADDISQGAAEIRNTRAETRDRAEVEHDWGTLTGGYADTGRHTQGSARVFFGSTAPTNLLKPDDTSQGVALGTGDSGRPWIDTSGIYPRLHYWTGTAFTGTHPTWNGFLNGQFKVNQRTAFAAPETAGTAKTYWFDRWYTIHTTAAGTITRETASLPTGSISPVGARVIGGAACTAARIGQRIESARAIALGADRLTNCFVTVSGKVRNTGASTITANLVMDAANALDNFTAVTNVDTAAGLISVAAGASQSFSRTVDIGTASAGTPSNGLDIYVVTTAPAAFVATEFFVLTDMQIEVGRVVTTLWPEDFAEQLPSCSRFYQKTFNYTTKPANNAGFAGSLASHVNAGGTNEVIGWQHEEMRAAPTIAAYNPGGGTAGQPQNGDNASSGSALAATAGTRNSYVRFTGSGAGQPANYVHLTADSEL